MSESKKEVLAASGVSPWNHQAQVIDGALVLYWEHKGEERIRTFTKEETVSLLDLLYNWRHEILKHDEQ